MVIQEDMYPEFPKMECMVCLEVIEYPRFWTTTPHLGAQIFINWTAGEELMKAHADSHNTDLISGLENMLREDANRRGR